MAKKLIGVREIQRHLNNVSEATVIGLINQGMPAERNKDGIWEAEAKAVDAFVEGLRGDKPEPEPEGKPKGKGTKKRKGKKKKSVAKDRF